MRTGAELVVVLGWSVDDFESACHEAEPGALREALAILEAEDPPETPERIIERARCGVLIIRRQLA